MKSPLIFCFVCLALFASTFLLTGCPPDVGVQFQVSPDSLDYGQTDVRRILRVAKNYTAGNMEPVVVSADQGWIMVGACRSTSDQCISNGPLDKIRIPVRIDRNKLALGLNTGKVYVQAGSLAPVVVPVTVEETVKADFSAKKSQVNFGQSVEFIDLSHSMKPADSIRSWLWDFGDGNTSSAPNPVHVYGKAGTFSVSLTIETTRGIRRTAMKTDYVVIESPSISVDFSASKTNVTLGQPITFTDLSASESTPVTARLWDFGDGNTSRNARPQHTYGASGIYSVTLTITTASGNYSSTKKNYIVVQQAGRLLVDIASENTYVSEEAQFTAIVFNAVGETTFIWNFGDGNLASEQNPRHRFMAKGTYQVELTVTDANTSATVTETITVTYKPPQALFSAKPTKQTKEKPVEFIDKTTEGYGDIASWKWTFGDGGTSTEQNPTYTYNKVGLYTVTLEVTADDPDAQKSTFSRKDYIEITEAPIDPGEDLDLDRYVAVDDGCFEYPTPTKQFVLLDGQPLATAYLVNKMTSQCWNPDEMVSSDQVEWVHPVAIIVPSYKMSDTAMLFIDGGSRSSVTEMDEVLAQIAIFSGTTIVHIKNVPSQPIVFKDEIIPAGAEDNYTGEPNVLRSRSEDEIIAYSYEKYLESYVETNGNPTYEWPVLFPMAKAAVKAMDMAEEILSKNNVALDGFVVAGASKRGWTTWLTGAVDSRIKGIAPIVINVLNMKSHLEHHRASYGYWSPAIYDYAQKGIFDRLISAEPGAPLAEEAKALLEQVDPYQYSLRQRYPMPKFMMNATGDEFFVPDTTQFYFDELQGQKHLCYIPNVGHGMGGLDEEDITNPSSPAGMLLGWYMAVTQKRPLPSFTQTFEDDGAIRVEIDKANPPVAVRLWQATSEGQRDFRNPILGEKWTASLMTPLSAGVYRARPAEPEEGNYTGFFIQLEYTSPAQLPAPALLAGYEKPNLVFSTGVRVLPVLVGGDPVYPEFTGYMANDSDAVPFTEGKLPVAVVYGAPYDMGQRYGTLLAEHINAFVPEFIDDYTDITSQSEGALTATWDAVSSSLDPRILDEIEGIASAPGVTVSLASLQMAHAAMLYMGGLWDTTTTMAYGDMLAPFEGLDPTGHELTINTGLSLDLADHLCAVLYIPNQGLPHTVFTYAGLAFGLTGINLGGISTSEVPNPDLLQNNANALPLLRSVLYDALSLREAIADVTDNLPINTTLIIGDSRNENRAVRIRTGDEGEEPVLRYDLAFSEFALKRPGIVYDTRPDLQAALKFGLNTEINSLDLEDLYGIANLTPFATSGQNILNVLYEGITLSITSNPARSPLSAYQNQPGITFYMQELLP